MHRAPFRQSLAERLGGAYVSIFRGVPLLVLLLFIYYFLADPRPRRARARRRDRGLGFSSGAYQAEILRGALNAVPRGQGEAATALGYAALDRWRRILLPQALRISIPPLINEFILLIKASSLVSVVGIAEITRVSMNIASMTYRPLEAYVAAGLFYLAINLSLAGLGALAEAMLGGERTMNLDILSHYAPALAGGFGVTILCWGLAAALGLVIGFVVALGAETRIPPAALAAARLRRSLPRHAVPGAALPPLLGRPEHRLAG